MSRLVLDEPIAGSKYRLVLDEPVKFRLVPDEPSDKPKPSLFKKTVREYSAQLADLLKVPSALTGLPHLPMESELATKTLPFMARRTVERAVTPIKTFNVPSISTRNIKEIGKLLTGQKPKFETSEVSPSPLDIGFMVALGAFGIKDVSQRVKFNNVLSSQLGLPEQGIGKAASDVKLNILKFAALKAKQAGKPLSPEFLRKHLGEKLASRYSPKVFAEEIAIRQKPEQAVVAKPLSLPAPAAEVPISPAIAPKPLAVAFPPVAPPIIPIPKVAIAQPPIAPIPTVSFTPAVITDKARI